MNTVQYAGFWIRSLASLIDSVLITFIIAPIGYAIYGAEYLGAERSILGFWDVILHYIFPMIAVITFWVYKSATPGKIILQLIIVDAATGEKPSIAQFIGRYFAYIPASLPLFIGIIWVAFDEKKQGWHDKMAKTIVVRYNNTQKL